MSNWNRWTLLRIVNFLVVYLGGYIAILFGCRDWFVKHSSWWMIAVVIVFWVLTKFIDSKLEKKSDVFEAI